MSSTCFEHPSVNPQEDLYMHFYGISFTHAYKYSGRWQDVCDMDQNVYTDAWKNYHKTACTSLPDDEHLDVRNTSKTL